jgi:hypothetical protein
MCSWVALQVTFVVFAEKSDYSFSKVQVQLCLVTLPRSAPQSCCWVLGHCTVPGSVQVRYFNPPPASNPRSLT